MTNRIEGNGVAAPIEPPRDRVLVTLLNNLEAAKRDRDSAKAVFDVCEADVEHFDALIAVHKQRVALKQQQPYAAAVPATSPAGTQPDPSTDETGRGPES